MEEIWKPIEELPEKYLISNHGRVKYIGGYRNKKDTIMLGNKDKKGYYHINMWDGVSKKCISKTIHYLVARAFVDNPNGYNVINHKDENPSNNLASNLEWCTYKYNNEYGTAKSRASKTRLRNGVSKKVIVYDTAGNLVNEFDSVYAASKFYNASSANISACCNHKGSYKTINNLAFRFEGDSWEFEKLNYNIIFGIYLNNELVFEAKGVTQASKFLNIKRSCMKGKLYRYRTKGKPMICDDYKIFILKEKINENMFI